ncbi:MBL fold metallo-hydrolase [Ochrobactrum sp. XJ1]|nr:MBL fold metallo-hydrolase [Ochrobactrum sp. XJ1]
MRIVKINDEFAIATQLEVADLKLIAERGFTKIVNLRPDLGRPSLLDNATEKAAANSAGLLYDFVPIRSSSITLADIRALQRSVSNTDGPIVVHAREPDLALIVYAIAKVLDGEIELSELHELGRIHEVDLSPAEQWIEQHNSRRPIVEAFFDPRTFSVQYVVTDPETSRCAIIDPVYDYDEKSGSTSTKSADAILDYISRNGLSVEWILDTHPHADHFSAAHYLKQKTGAPTAIGAHVVDVQKLWQAFYNWPDLQTDGTQWDNLFHAGDTFKIGNLEGRVLFSPGHTLASITYVIGDAAFIHDTLFSPEFGSARADFPGGDARKLWQSIHAILALPDETRLFTGHDYPSNGQHPRWESTVAEQKRANPHVAGVTEEQYVSLREARDRTLPMPKLILHALQVNIRGGRLPEPDDTGRRYLKIPIDAFEGCKW